MSVVQSEKVSSAIRKVQENVYGNVSFQEALVWREVDNVVLGLLVFFVSVKFLRLIRLNKHVAVFSKTLKKSARHLSSLNVFFVILFIAFLHFGILIFGAGFERYSSVLKGSFFQVELTSGSSESKGIPSVRAHHNIFGRIFAAMILLSTTISDELLHRHSRRHTCSGKPTLRPWRGRMQLEENKINQRHHFYDKISNSLRQRKLEETLACSRKAEDGTLEVNSRSRTRVNFDVITQQIKASMEQMIEASGIAKQNNPRKSPSLIKSVILLYI